MTWWRFEWGGNTYTFPPLMESWSDNFASLEAQTERLPGAHGGFDHYGNRSAPGPIGTVQLAFKITDDWAERTYSGGTVAFSMQLARDALNKLASWGKGRLFKPAQVSVELASERWCWARVTGITMNEGGSENSHVWQAARVTFEVSDPFWYEAGTAGSAWGDFNWNGGPVWGGAGAEQACSGIKTDWTLTRIGSAVTYPRITILGGSGGINGFRLQRLVEGTVEDEVRYGAMLGNGARLEIDCRAKRVILNKSQNAYNANFDYETARWFALAPGANAIRMVMGDSGNASTVNFRYLEAYR